MKLDAITIAYIHTAVKTAKLVGTDAVIIEPGMVRAYHQDNGVAILQDKDVPEMPFGSIALARLDIFASRYDLVRTQTNFAMEVDIDEDANCVKSLIMKAKGTKIDYRCTKPTNIKAPRQINDTMKYRIKLNGESVVLINKAMSAMSAPEHMTLISNDGVSLELTDVNSDVFKHTIMEKPEGLTPDANGKFAYRYFAKTLLPLLKQDSEGHFEVGTKGILAFHVNNLTVYVLPQA